MSKDPEIPKRLANYEGEASQRVSLHFLALRRKTRADRAKPIPKRDRFTNGKDEIAALDFLRFRVRQRHGGICAVDDSHRTRVVAKEEA